MPKAQVRGSNLLRRFHDQYLCPEPESSEDRLRALFSAVALNAILNAGGRGDEVRCHPGTQERVIEMLETWMGGKADSPDAGSKILWLSGRAGTGKSAIM